MALSIDTQTIQKNKSLDEQSDSSCDEGPLSRIGEVPLEWYDNFDIIGYDVEGKSVIREENPPNLRKLIKNAKKGKFAIYDALNNKLIDISKEELKTIQNIRHSKPPKEFDLYQDYNYANGEIIKHPWNENHSKKSLKIPKNEIKRIRKIVQALKTNQYIDPIERLTKKRKEKELERESAYSIWDDNNEKTAYKTVAESYLSAALNKQPIKRFRPYIPPANEILPGHNESYNPPEKYIFSKEEKEEWELTDVEERKISFMPQKCKSMGEIPSFEHSVKERFERAVQIYIKPRPKEKKKRREENMGVPRIDRTKFKPFPQKMGLEFTGHSARVVSITIDSTGSWLVSGSLDKTVRIWETATGRCCKTLKFEEKVAKVLFSPSSTRLAVLLHCDDRRDRKSSKIAFFTSEEIGIAKNGTDEIISEKGSKPMKKIEYRPKGEIFKNFEMEFQRFKGEKITERNFYNGGFSLKMATKITSINWHKKGRHVVVTTDLKPHLLVVKISGKKLEIQTPLKKLTRTPRDAFFALEKNVLFVVLEKKSLLYDLSLAKRQKELKTGDGVITAAACDGNAKRLLAGCSSGELCYFDVEMTGKPYRFDCHSRSVKAVAFHPKLPLFATTSADGETHIFYNKVFDDFGGDAEIVPVNYLRVEGESKTSGGILDCVFHPIQPWLFCCGDGNSIRLFLD